MTPRRMFALVAALVGFAALATPAGAVMPPCRVACAGAARSGVVVAQVARIGCRASCRSSGSPRDCRLACTTASKQARAAAMTTLVQCRQSCGLWDGCEATCAASGQTCLAPLGDSAKTCTTACAATVQLRGAWVPV